MNQYPLMNVRMRKRTVIASPELAFHACTTFMLISVNLSMVGNKTDK